MAITYLKSEATEEKRDHIILYWSKAFVFD